MKTNDKDIERTSVTPHAVERGYTVPLVEVGDELTDNGGVGNGSVLGCNANNSGNASARTADCNNHAGNSNSNYVGSWSLTKDIQFSAHTPCPARADNTDSSAATCAQGQCDYGSLPYWGEDIAESNASLSPRDDIFNQIREANRKRKLKSLKRFLTDIRVIEAAFDRTMERSHTCKQEIAKWVARREEVCRQIQHQLITQTYHPQPTKPRDIKPRGKGGKVRHAEVSTMYDRIVTNVFYLVVEHKFKAMLTRNVYSGIDGRSLLSNDRRYCMINVIRHWAQTHPDSYVGQTDIRHFYENLHTKVVIGIMFKTIVCPFARWMLLRMFELLDTVPIGGGLSQLMAMIAVNECDRELLRRYHVFLCCFGDNRLIGGDRQTVRKAMSFQMSYYEGALLLSVKGDYHINPVSKGFTFCKYRFHKSYVSVRGEIRRRAIRAKGKGQQHYAGYKGMLLKTDSKRLRYLIENGYMMLTNRHGMQISTQRGDKRKFRDLEDHSIVIPYDYRIVESEESRKDKGVTKYYVDVTYIYVSKEGQKRLYHSTEGSEEVVGFFRLVEEGKAELRQVLHVGHTGTQSYFEEYHTTKEEACNIICDELDIDNLINSQIC